MIDTTMRRNLLSLLVLSFTSVLSSPTSAPSAKPCFSETKQGGCWDLGVEYNIPSVDLCQKACLLLPQCHTFMYSPQHQKCYFCSDENLEWEDNRCGDGCLVGPDSCRDENIPLTVTNVLQSNMKAAAAMCSDTIEREFLQDPRLQLDIFDTAKTINQIVRYRDEYREATLTTAFQEAANNAAIILQSSECTTGCDGILYLQLQSMVLMHELNGNVAFPFHQTRADLVDDFRVLIADNGWLNEETLDAIYNAFDYTPNHIKTGLNDDAPFAVLYLPDTYSCDNAVEDLVAITNVTYGISPAFQFNESEIQSFPSNTPMMPPSGDYLMTLIKEEIASRLYQQVIRNPRLASRFNSLYLQSTKGNQTNHFLGNEDPQFYKQNPQEIFKHHIGRQYMFSSSSQLSLAIARWGAVDEGPSESVSEARRCSDIDKDLGNDISSRLGCRNAAQDEDSCQGNFFMWDGNGRCSCCSADASFLEDSDWTVYKYKDNAVPQIPTPLPLSWWLLNVDIFADLETSTSTFYEYDRYGIVVPVCVNIWRDDIGRIETIEVPGCGLIDFNYSENDGFLVDSVTDNALTCHPDRSQAVCQFGKEKPTTGGTDENSTPSSACDRQKIYVSIVVWASCVLAICFNRLC
eukprot:scaffold22620_cov131-Cylindrotheca_fusiformis.AAC.5